MYSGRYSRTIGGLVGSPTAPAVAPGVPEETAAVKNQRSAKSYRRLMLAPVRRGLLDVVMRSPFLALTVMWLSSVVLLIPTSGPLVVPVAVLDAGGTWLRARRRGRSP